MIRRLAGLAAFFAIPFVMIAIFVQNMLAEQAHIHQHYFPPVPPPPGLLEREKEFVSWAADYRVAIIKKARRHKICFEVFKYVAGLAALATGLSLSLGAPSWVFVVFGFVSTVALFLMAAGQHQKRYTLLHRQAVKPSSCRSWREISPYRSMPPSDPLSFASSSKPIGTRSKR